MLAVAIIDKLSQKTGLLLTSLNVHRVVLVALAVAAKVRDDVYYSNKYYASVGGVSTRELNRLETALLTDCDWEVFVGEPQYKAYVEHFGMHEACAKQSAPSAAVEDP
eukprot:TRINITY_DN3062_c0_g3_i1.p2 TRINITY_DN3062_c0_g3~~TRINITY_DN3062_c0_g3_i1.p2  ORF type:complete len:108 (+),score=31.83 TRINITY_DN3062_c0_g3_i1:379-702(+)